jgi:hypothetical protein
MQAFATPLPENRVNSFKTNTHAQEVPHLRRPIREFPAGGPMTGADAIFFCGTASADGFKTIPVCAKKVNVALTPRQPIRSGMETCGNRRSGNKEITRHRQQIGIIDR